MLSLFFFLGGPLSAEETSLTLSPPPKGEVEANDLIVSASVSGPLSQAMDLGNARLFVDGRNVTGLCLRTQGYLSYRPMSPLPPGAVEARLEFTNGVVRQWNFQVVPSHLIKTVSHDAHEALGEYQEMTVKMEGEPGLKATFSIDNDEKEYPMEEVSRGFYQGTYTVKPGDYYLGVPIKGHLHLGSRVETRKSGEEANLFGHLFRVHIFEPLSGKAPSNNFVIKGRTRPGSRVSIVPRLSFNKNTQAPLSRWSTDAAGTIEADVDEDGFFEVGYGVPLSLPNLSVVLAVYAVSPDGERSVPITLRYDF